MSRAGKLTFRIGFVVSLLANGGCEDPALMTAPDDAFRAARLPALGFELSSISAGSDGACGVDAGGRAYCWGHNSTGRLGNGSNSPSGVPVPVSGGLTFTSLAGNWFATCGLTKTGRAYCWGDGFLGQLGDGTRGSSTVPVAVSGGHTFSPLATSRLGFGFSCGVTKGRETYCWGIGGEGQLGNGSSTPGIDFDTPVQVLGGLTFAAVSPGEFHSCGITKAGQAYCWGDNSNGQLGLGYTSPSFGSGSSVPTPVSSGQIFVEISAGSGHTCGVTKGGAGYCWGANGFGQLGDGSTTARNAPVAIAGGLTFSSISAGFTSTCGVTRDGQAFCWGSNASGELGIGSTGNDPVTSPTLVAGGFTFTSISTGYYFACGLTSKLGAFCWGRNDFGQLGSGLNVPYTDAPTPVALP